MTRGGATLRISGAQRQRLQRHLFPGDGLEAAAILICARLQGRRTTLVVRDVLLVPHGECAVRESDRLSWPGERLEQAIDLAGAHEETLVLLHSHPGGFFAFSDLDEASDRLVMPGLFEAIEAPHGSAIMTPDGAVRARLHMRDAIVEVAPVVIAGDDIIFYWPDGRWPPGQRPLAFTAEMTRELSALSTLVVGVSGTGSIIAEQAVRMGFGEVDLVDPDQVEPKNLNRILNSTVDDARAGAAKAEMFAAASRRHAPATQVRAFASSVLDRDVVFAAAEADVIFCCVDSHEGRQICDLIASAFGIPLIDMGVQIPVTRDACRAERIAGVFGRVDYVQPGGASLQDREVYSAQSVAEEYVARVAPHQHAQEVRDGYMKGRVEEAPSVISLNMRCASAAMMEFIARAYPFRHEPNDQFARTLFDLASGDEDHVAEAAFLRAPDPLAGTGAREPLLGLPALNRRRRAVA